MYWDNDSRRIKVSPAPDNELFEPRRLLHLTDCPENPTSTDLEVSLFARNPNSRIVLSDQMRKLTIRSLWFLQFVAK